MPSIPAVHFNTIENNIKQEIDEVTPIDILDFKTPDKFQLLFYFVLARYFFRVIRLYILLVLSIKPNLEGPVHFEIVHPLIAIRCFILLWRTYLPLDVWDTISDYFGWDWFEYR